MPDFNSTFDVIAERLRQDAEHAARVDAAWWIVLTIGAGLLVAIAVAAVILGVYWFSTGWRRTPPKPTSIVSAQPQRHRRYTEPKRR